MTSTPEPRRVIHDRFECGGVEFRVIALEPPRVPAMDRLTEAERDVASRTIAGLRPAEIAQQRGSSVRTVQNQLARIYRTLGICSRGELVAIAAQAGAR